MVLGLETVKNDVIQILYFTHTQSKTDIIEANVTGLLTAVKQHVYAFLYMSSGFTRR